MSVNAEGASGVGPLTGIRILELGHFIAAPFCTRVLADLGAEIIKVEPPGKGDPVRSWGAIPEGEASSVWWSVHGRNKKSVTINLKAPEGAALALQLAATCDAVVENFKPGQLAKWGLGPEEIAEAAPEAILVQISGYGQTGPHHKRAAFGVIGEAMGGLRHLTGYPKEVTDLPPVRTGVAIGDSVAGLYGAIGLLAALVEKKAQGVTKGRRVDVALTESVFSLLEGCLPEYGATGAVRQPQGARLATNAPSSAYPTKDGRWFLIAANSDALFARLAAKMERPDLLTDPRFADNPTRVANAAALDAEIGAWTAQYDMAALEEMMEAADVPASRIHDIADIAKNPQFRARGMVAPVDDPRLGEVLHPGVVPRMENGSAGGVRHAGPDVGADTDAVLTGLLGLAGPAVEALRKGGVI